MFENGAVSKWPDGPSLTPRNRVKAFFPRHQHEVATHGECGIE